MKIRRATPKDAAQLCDYMAMIREESPLTLYKRDKDPTVDEERDFIGTANRLGILLICVDKTIVGMLGARIPAQEQRRHCCEFGMSVLRDYRGQGIGTRLIKQLISWARKQGLGKIECNAFGNNLRAVRLYKRLGFTIEGRRKKSVRIEGNFEDIIELGKLIQIPNKASRCNVKGAP